MHTCSFPKPLKQTRIFTLEQERDSTHESSQSEILGFQKQVQFLEERLSQSQEQVTKQASDLTHSFEEEMLILNFKIQDLEAKLEDSRAASQDNLQEEVDVNVVQCIFFLMLKPVVV